jgi:uncharacterized protein YbbK (DUF523 family)
MIGETVIVSACLLGINCRYDGGHAYCPEVFDDLSQRHFIPVCPEQLGGLTTPRLPARIEGGDGADVWHGKAKVINQSGEEVTEAFQKGAQETLAIAQLAKAKRAILKDHSPSCGSQFVYATAGLIKGIGVTAALLAKNGMAVENELGEPLLSK